MSAQLAGSRQPFAPLNSSRLQNLTSRKNRQNAIASSPVNAKRKAACFDADLGDEDSENVDPAAFLSPKRSKGLDGSASAKDAFGKKPINYFLTTSPTAKASPRVILNARSPAAPRRLDAGSVAKAPLSAPAGRIPTRKRIGILNRRKTSGGGSPFTRIDPPKFASSATPPTASLGFSIDAALSGTIPSYTARPKPEAAAERGLPIPELYREPAKASWHFEIYEDTEEELATNLMEHGACTLDISSDEESAARERDLRGKENVPPEDGGDVSQRSSAAASTVLGAELAGSKIKAKLRRGRPEHESAIEVDRCPLGDLVAADFYAADCCDGSEGVVLVADEADASALITPPHEDALDAGEASLGVASTLDFAADIIGKGKGVEVDIDVLMARSAEGAAAPAAKLLEPIESAEAGWTVWESGSAKGDEE